MPVTGVIINRIVLIYVTRVTKNIAVTVPLFVIYVIAMYAILAYMNVVYVIM